MVCMQIYISESSNRIQSDEKTYSSKFLDGKRLEYYIIVPDYEQNTADVERYKKWAFMILKIYCG